MDKIEADLFDKITTNPKHSFDIVLCTSINNNFSNKNWTQLMDGIYYAKLTGEEIKTLAKHDDVLAIESDSKTGIF